MIDTGELIVTGVVGCLIALFYLCSLQNHHNIFRHLHKHLGVGLLALFGFGVVVDMWHVVAPVTLQPVLAIVEDGGEMLALSYMLSCLLNIKHLNIFGDKSSYSFDVRML